MRHHETAVKRGMEWKEGQQRGDRTHSCDLVKFSLDRETESVEVCEGKVPVRKQKRDGNETIWKVGAAVARVTPRHGQNTKWIRTKVIQVIIERVLNLLTDFQETNKQERRKGRSRDREVSKLWEDLELLQRIMSGDERLIATGAPGGRLTGRKNR